MLFSKLKINPFLWIIVFLAIITGYFRTLILLFSIIFIHEMGHVIAAYYFKWRIKKIELLPFGGVAEVEEYGNRPFKEELVVVLAGPFQHILMLAFAYISHHLGWMEKDFYKTFVEFNIMLLTFNLLPVWPLDGGKLLLLLYAKQFPYKKAHRIMLTTSLTLLLLMLAFSTFYFPFQLNIWIIATFLLISHYTEWKQRQFLFMRFLTERLYGTKRGKMKKLIVDPNKQIKDVVTLFYKDCQHEIVIKGSYSFKKISEERILHTMFNESLSNLKIKEIL